MPAKKLLAAALIASLLTACGGGAGTQALPGDGTYDDTVVPADGGYGADGIGGDPATGDPYGSGTGTGTGTGTTDPTTGSGDGQIGDPTGQGFTLRGLVADQLGQPLAGAKVSIGAQTTLTSATGEFEITGIMDSQVWVDVSKDGFETISRFNVAFTNEKPTADKEFKLAPAGSGASDGGGSETPDVGPSLSHEGTFGGPAWKSVSGMAVDGNRVYVLGKIDKKLWFDRSAVVVFDASSGEEISRIGDVLFSKVPKDASSIKVEDGEVIVSNGTERASFDAAGEFVQSSSGGGYDSKKSATDKDRGIVYAIKSGTKLTIDSKNFDGELRLDDVGNARSIALDDDGRILILDDGQKTVHVFTFE